MTLERFALSDIISTQITAICYRKGIKLTKINTIISSLLLVASLLVSSIHAEEPASKAEFNQAYKSYQSLSQAGKWHESLPHAKKAYDLGHELYADKSETQAALADNYGLNLMELHQFEDATPVLQEAVNLYEKIYGLDSVELILPLMDISRSLAKINSSRAFNKNLERAIKISETHHGVDSAEHGQMLLESAPIFAKAGQANKVRKSLEKGHSNLLTALGENHPRTGVAAYSLGSLAYSKNRLNKSVDYFEAALKSFEFPDQPSNQYELKTHSVLVSAYEQLNQREKATRHCLAIGRMTPRKPLQDYVPLLKIAPIYPRKAAERGVQGEVTVQFDVDESGIVINPTIFENKTRSTALEKASIVAALKFRYAPGFVDGKPVVTEGVKNRFTYKLVN